MVALAATAGVSAPTTPSAESAACRPGSVAGVIGGKQRCLKPGQRCQKRFDRQYHRYRFHCHTGRLTRAKQQPPPLPPGAAITARIATDALPLALAAANGSIWLAHHTAGTVLRIDPQTNAITSRIAVGSGAGGLVGSDDSVWVVRHATTIAARIDTAANALGQQVDVAAAGANSLCCFPAFGNGSVWMIDGNGLLVRLDAGTGAVLAKLQAGEGPSSGVLFAAGAVWGSGRNDGVVWRVDPATNRVVARIKVGSGAGTLGATAPAAYGFGSVWVANADDGSVARIDPATNAVIAKIRVSQSSLFYSGLAVAQDSVWAHDSAGYLWRIAPQTNTVVGRLQATLAPGPVLAAYGSLWIVDWRNNVLVRAQPENVSGVVPLVASRGARVGGGGTGDADAPDERARRS